MDNLQIYELCRAVPESAKKPINAGRLKGFTDINPMWRIKRLTEVFGACGFGWWYKITDKRLDGSDGEIRAFVDIELFVRWNGEVSQPIPGTGGSSFLTKEKNGAYTSDECFKMALTDAISVAAKALGVGADVYFDKDRDKYTTVADEKTPNESSRYTADSNGDFQPTCSDCGKVISIAEHDWSVKWYGAPLCREHQKTHPKIR